jgi:hypothetical protein
MAGHAVSFFLCVRMEEEEEKEEEKKDGRPAALAIRRQHRRTTKASTIPARLSRVLPATTDANRRLRQVIDEAVLTVTALAALGSRLAIFHVARCLANAIPLPPLDTTFFRGCMLAFTLAGRPYIPQPDLDDTILEAQRVAGDAWPTFDHAGMTYVLAHKAAEMATVAATYLVTRLQPIMRKRLMAAAKSVAPPGVTRGMRAYAVARIVFAVTRRPGTVQVAFQHPWQQRLYEEEAARIAATWDALPARISTLPKKGKKTRKHVHLTLPYLATALNVSASGLSFLESVSSWVWLGCNRTRRSTLLSPSRVCCWPASHLDRLLCP